MNIRGTAAGSIGSIPEAWQTVADSSTAVIANERDISRSVGRAVAAMDKL